MSEGPAEGWSWVILRECFYIKNHASSGDWRGEVLGATLARAVIRAVLILKKHIPNRLKLFAGFYRLVKVTFEI